MVISKILTSPFDFLLLETFILCQQVPWLAGQTGTPDPDEVLDAMILRLRSGRNDEVSDTTGDAMKSCWPVKNNFY